MGYTTTFRGRFNLDKTLAPEHAEYLRRDRIREEGAPDGYFQWKPTQDLRGVEWDENEKFNDYITWLRFVARKMTEWSYRMNGTVQWWGEISDDVGTLTVSDNVVTWEGSDQNRGGEHKPRSEDYYDE